MATDQLYSELAISSSRLQLAGIVDIAKNQQEARETHKKDAAEFREQLLMIVRQQDAMTNLLTNTSDVQQLMRTIQEEIQQDENEPVKAQRQPEQDRRDLQDTLYFLHKEADVLPPISDRDLFPCISTSTVVTKPVSVTHEVQKLSEHAVAHGGDNDIYIGKWLGQERVALKFTRGCNHSDAAKEKFYREVTIWRSLQHPNIVRLYGTAVFGDYIYTVSPWMDNGNALQFLQHHPDHDRRQLVLEVAQGLNYLHSQGVIHGDLRCAHILISKSKVARISDFGLSILVSTISEHSGKSGVGHDMTIGSLRWCAPELIDPPSIARVTKTHSSDVWGFGMLCMEVFTGEKPYFELGRNDVTIMKAITGGETPLRQGSAVGSNLDDALWQIMMSCWQKAASDRPTIQQVVNRLKRKLSASPMSGERLFTSESPPSSPFDTSVRYTFDSPTSERNQDRFGSSSSAISTRQRRPTLGISQRAPNSLNGNRIEGTSISAANSLQINNLAPSISSSSSSGSRNSIPGQNSYSTSFSHPRLVKPPNQSASSLIAQVNGSSSNRGSDALMNSRQCVDRLRPSTHQHYHDQSQDLHSDPNGVALHGTLKGLIDRLALETDSFQQDLEFRVTFLTCYTAFMTSDELFFALAAQFHKLSEMDQNSNGSGTEGCHNILLVLRLWLTNNRLSAGDSTTLELMEDFALGLANSTSNRMQRTAELLIDIIRTKKSEVLRPRRWDGSHSSQIMEGFRASTKPPREFAIGLTILSWDMFSELQQTDFVAWLTSLPGGECIEGILKTWDKISYWTRHTILLSDSAKVRAARLQLFIGIANECRSLRNYVCMSAIASACSHPWISRLKYTSGDIDRQAKEALRSINSVLDSHDNFRNYREDISLASRYRKAMVPDLAIHCRDLKSLWERSASKLKSPQVDLNRFREDGALAYLENQLNSFTVSEQQKLKTESRATELQLVEERDYVTRQREMREAGFRTSQSVRRL